MLLDRLQKKNLIHPPKWMVGSTVYLTIMGSQAYGVSAASSDVDIYGCCIPHKNIIFPHTAGIIAGFGNQGEIFEQWSEHHIKDPDKEVEYDFSVYNIVKYFSLCMDNNPNMIDSLFTPRNCVIHSTHVGEIIRENRKLFLHKGSWHRFKGYAYAQMSKIKNKVNASNPERAETIRKFGYDVKFAYHVVRLLNEVEMILVEGDLDLQRNNEQLKSIRRGEWKLEDLVSYFVDKEKILEKTYAESPLRKYPDEFVIKDVLLNCLETHFGDISTAVKRDIKVDDMVRDLEALLAKYQVANA
jgi:predicted nucleotidyltransferase